MTLGSGLVTYLDNIDAIARMVKIYELEEKWIQDVWFLELYPRAGLIMYPTSWDGSEEKNLCKTMETIKIGYRHSERRGGLRPKGFRPLSSVLVSIPSRNDAICRLCLNIVIGLN